MQLNFKNLPKQTALPLLQVCKTQWMVGSVSEAQYLSLQMLSLANSAVFIADMQANNRT